LLVRMVGINFSHQIKMERLRLKDGLSGMLYPIPKLSFTRSLPASYSLFLCVTLLPLTFHHQFRRLTFHHQGGCRRRFPLPHQFRRLFFPSAAITILLS
jgi:hypothetical protein